MKKFSCVLFLTFMIFLWSVFSETGMTSGETVCEVNMANIPDNTVFVELFIEEDVISDNYTKCNEIAVKQNNISPESEVVTANFDNFISYTYHHRDSSSLSNLNNYETIYNGENNNEVVYVVFWDGIEKKSIEKCNALMLAYVNESGQILEKSEVVYVNKLMDKSHFVVDGDKITVEYNNVKPSVKIVMFLSLVFIETVLFFVIRKMSNQKKNNTGDDTKPLKK